VHEIPPPAAIHLRAPIADRERMLWLAEKATELGVTTWQGVRFKRSASVSPRGEGGAFSEKLLARMTSALEQSGGAWLPVLLPDIGVDELESSGDKVGIVLDIGGVPLPEVLRLAGRADPVILLGPEGGIETDEMDALVRRDWHRARLSPTTLRFETAGIAAVAVCRAMETRNPVPANG
jgi:16S rRNA (uracil1498-N3)-methyltransferase